MTHTNKILTGSCWYSKKSAVGTVEKKNGEQGCILEENRNNTEDISVDDGHL